MFGNSRVASKVLFVLLSSQATLVSTAGASLADFEKDIQAARANLDEEEQLSAKLLGVLTPADAELLATQDYDPSLQGRLSPGAAQILDRVAGNLARAISSRRFRTGATAQPGRIGETSLPVTLFPTVSGGQFGLWWRPSDVAGIARLYGIGSEDMVAFVDAYADYLTIYLDKLQRLGFASAKVNGLKRMVLLVDASTGRSQSMAAFVLDDRVGHQPGESVFVYSLREGQTGEQRYQLVQGFLDALSVSSVAATNASFRNVARMWLQYALDVPVVSGDPATVAAARKAIESLRIADRPASADTNAPRGAAGRGEDETDARPGKAYELGLPE